MVSLLVSLIVIALLVWILFYVLQKMPLPDPARTVVWVLVALVIIVLMVRQFGLMGGL
jgi:hypothetical protein